MCRNRQVSETLLGTSCKEYVVVVLLSIESFLGNDGNLTSASRVGNSLNVYERFSSCSCDGAVRSI